MCIPTDNAVAEALCVCVALRSCIRCGDYPPGQPTALPGHAGLCRESTIEKYGQRDEAECCEDNVHRGTSCRNCATLESVGVPCDVTPCLCHCTGRGCAGLMPRRPIIVRPLHACCVCLVVDGAEVDSRLSGVFCHGVDSFAGLCCCSI